MGRDTPSSRSRIWQVERLPGVLLPTGSLRGPLLPSRNPIVAEVNSTARRSAIRRCTLSCSPTGERPPPPSKVIPIRFRNHQPADGFELTQKSARTVFSCGVSARIAYPTCCLRPSRDSTIAFSPIQERSSASSGGMVTIAGTAERYRMPCRTQRLKSGLISARPSKHRASRPAMVSAFSGTGFR